MSRFRPFLLLLALPVAYLAFVDGRLSKRGLRSPPKASASRGKAFQEPDAVWVLKRGGESMAHRPSVRSDVVGCSVATVLGAAVIKLLARVVGERYHRDVAGSPLYTWWVGCLHQLVLFPGCFALAVREFAAARGDGVDDGSFLHAWLASPWDGDTFWRSVFHYVAFGYWFKDLLVVPSPPEILVHHVACLALTVLSLASPKWLPCSATFVTGPQKGASLLLQSGVLAIVCVGKRAHPDEPLKRDDHLGPNRMSS